MRPYVLVGLGGLLGSVGRFWLSGRVQQVGGGVFPYGTLVVNVLGSFVLGLLATLAADGRWITPNLRLFLGVGLCGGFTTMSAFSYENVFLLSHGHNGLAVANIAVTLGVCLAAVWAGMAVGRLT